MRLSIYIPLIDRFERHISIVTYNLLVNISYVSRSVSVTASPQTGSLLLLQLLEVRGLESLVSLRSFIHGDAARCRGVHALNELSSLLLGGLGSRGGHFEFRGQKDRRLCGVW